MKNAPVSELISAVRSVRNGEAVFDSKAIGKVLGRLATEPGAESKGLAGLHDREVQVLKIAAKGLSNKHIAEKLGISDRTVQTHMFHIFRKLEVGSRTEAVFQAVKRGWLSFEELP